MKLNINTRVTFYESPHKYVLDNGKELIGVTSLMRKFGLSPDYGGIDEETLAHAAALGSMAHQVIENYVNGLPCVDSPLLKSFAKLGLNIIATEYLVSDNETVASAVDLIEGVDEHSVILWDMKRTSTVHRDALSWQLGIYKYLFELNNPTIEVVGCKCLPIKKGNKDDIERDTCGRPVDINPVPAKEVERLLECEKNGTLYTPVQTDGSEVLAFSDTTEISAIFGASQKLAEAQQMVKEAEAALVDFKDKAYQYMLEHNLDQISYGGVTVKLKRPYMSSRLDTTKFKKDHPELADLYIKTAETKGNVSISIN